MLTKIVDKLLVKCYHDENRNAQSERGEHEMVENIDLVDELASTIIVCHHHWIIDMPSGRLSQGQCKLCGETKEFMNSIEGGFWEDDAGAPTANAVTGYLSGPSPTTQWSESEEERF